MNTDLIKELGIGGALIFLFMKELFSYLKSKKDESNEPINNDLNIKIDKILTVCEEMFKLHDVRDADGVPVWYVRRSMETLLKELVDVVQRLNKNVEIQTEIYKNTQKRD